MEYDVRPVTADLWDELAAFFGPSGAYSNCWCAWWRVTSNEFSAGCASGGEGNREVLHKLTVEGRVPGLLAYAANAGHPAEAGYSADAGHLAKAEHSADTRHLAELAHPAEAGHPAMAGYSAEAGHPADAGHPAKAGYATDARHLPELGHPADARHPAELEYSADARHLAELSRPADAGHPAEAASADNRTYPLGWVSVGPRPDFGRIGRSRNLKPATADDFDDASVWSVVCFWIPRGNRRKGVAHALLGAATSYAFEHGASAVEGYPVDTRGARAEAASIFTGTISMFEAAGFKEVLRRADKRPVMRRQREP